MRRRAAPVVRVLGECARCGATPREILRGEIVRLRMADGLPREHELRVCRACDARPTTPTHQERAAAGLDASNPVHGIEFFGQYGTDLARVQRTAAHFLGAAAWAQLVETERAATARYEAQVERWRADARAHLTEDDFLGRGDRGACAPADFMDDDEWAREG